MTTNLDVRGDVATAVPLHQAEQGDWFWADGTLHVLTDETDDGSRRKALSLADGVLYWFRDDLVFALAPRVLIDLTPPPF